MSGRETAKWFAGPVRKVHELCGIAATYMPAALLMCWRRWLFDGKGGNAPFHAFIKPPMKKRKSTVNFAC